MFQIRPKMVKPYKMGTAFIINSKKRCIYHKHVLFPYSPLYAKQWQLYIWTESFEMLFLVRKV